MAKKHSARLYPALALAAALALGACSSTPPRPAVGDAQAFGALNLTQAQYEELAADDESFEAQILLIRSCIASGEFDLAQSRAAQLQLNAQNGTQRDEAVMMNALLQARRGNLKDGAALLAPVNSRNLPPQARSFYHQLNSSINARLYEETRDAEYQLAAYRSQKALLAFMRGRDRITVLNRSAALLAALPESVLARALTGTQDYEDRGFLEYALITRSQSFELKDLALTDFRAKYASHVLNELFAAGTGAAESTEEEPESAQAQPGVPAPQLNPQSVFTLPDDARIAVLLPLTGRFAETVGTPARMGVLAALEARESRARAAFYDTNAMNMDEIVGIISNDGTSLIIGPVLKPELSALNASGSPLPSIVLNTPEDNRPVNQWYFDLGPNYEGALAASKIYADGHSQPLVIASSADQSAQRARQAFISSFSRVSAPRSCLYADAAQIRQSLEACDFTQADSVYVNAAAADTAAIKAVIPSQLPVYLTSKSYQGLNNTAQEMALSGAVLGEMPWLLYDSELKESFMKSLPKANAQVQRIFAASFDAVNLAFSLSELAQNSGDVLHGLTGDISLTPRGLIETSPMWVELGRLRL